LTAWSRWRPEIAKACDGSHHTIAAIERDIAGGRLHVLTLPACCYVVELVDYPAERACQITWAAGELNELVAGLTRVHTWAKAHNCTEMLVEGHPGWKRALQASGYGLWSVTLKRAL
jgi:hypothetical protein